MNLNFDILGADDAPVSEKQMFEWLRATLPKDIGDTEVSLKIVSKQECAQLNETYRGKTGPTNVLSFPAELHSEVELPLLGDLVICAEVIEQEAEQQNKSLDSHWAHMIVHGTLHLLGYDHIEEDAAIIMEEKEIAILKVLGFPNPY